MKFMNMKMEFMNQTDIVKNVSKINIVYNSIGLFFMDIGTLILEEWTSSHPRHITLITNNI